MAELNHDAGGFLVGPRLTDDLDKISRELELLREIRGDTQETVEQLGKLADALSNLDSVTPAEPNRPPMPPREGDTGPGRDAVTPAVPGAADGAPLAPINVTVGVDIPPLEVAPGALPHNPAAPESAAPAPGNAPPAVAPVPASAREPVSAPASAPSVDAVPAPTAAGPAPAPAAPGLPPSSPRTRDDQGRFTATGTPAPASLATPAPAVADPREERIQRERSERRRKDRARREAAGSPGSTTNAPGERQRGADGRFGSASPGDNGDKGESRSAKAMGAASESLKSAADGLASGADNVDPAVTAVKEIGGIVSPVMGAIKPLGRLFGMGRSPDDKRQRESVRWYRRIWGELREGNKRSGGRGMGLLLTGLLSMLGMLMAPLRALARITGLMRMAGALGGLAKGVGGLLGGRGRRGAPGRDGRRGVDGRGSRRDALSERGRRTAEARSVHRNPETGRFESRAGTGPGPGRDGQARRSGATRNRAGAGAADAGEDAAGASRAGRGAGTGRAGRFSGLAKAGKGLLTKLPVVGALLGAGLFASAAMAKDDPSATAEERQANKTDRWGTMGGVVGGVVGGALGMFGGPAGAVLGGVLGDQLGTTVGEWLSKVDMTGMMASVTGAWTAVADGATKMASDAFGAVKEGWNSVLAVGASTFANIGEWAKESWGKVADTFSAVKTKVVETFLDTRDTIRDKVQTAKDYVGEKAATVKDAGQNVLNTVTGGHYTGGSNARKDELIKAMDAGGITDPKSKAALMANVDHESGGFKSKEENLNYSAKRLQQVFPKYYKDAESARADANNPEAIANRVYGGRMGNKDPGDGFKFRGRGDIQLTGRDQYERMGKKLGIDLVNNPELASDPKYSAQIAVQHWKDSGANALAEKGDIRGARVRTNGGTNGLADVETKYDKYLAQAKVGDLTPTRQANEVRVAAPEPAMEAINSTMAAVKGKAGATQPAGPFAVAPGAAPAPSAGKAAIPGITPLVTPLAAAAAPGQPGAAGADGAGAAGAPGAATTASLLTAVPDAAAAAGKAAIPGVTPLVLQPVVVGGTGAPGEGGKGGDGASTPAPVAAAPAAPGSAGVPATSTPALASATKLNTAQPVGVMPIPAASMSPVSPPANPGSVQAGAPAIMASTSAPASIPPLKVPNYSAPAPDAGQSRIPPTPQVPKPMAPASKAPAAPSTPIALPLTQNVSDRAIAHAATGGIGMGGFARSL